MTGTSRDRSRAGLSALATLVTLGLLAGLGLAGAGSATAGPAVARGDQVAQVVAPRAATASGTTQREVRLSWKGAVDRGRQSTSFPIPGIGTMSITCRPDVVRVSLKATVRDRETQMWMAKYEDKSYGRAVAVKTVRIYRYANIDDDGRGGTSNPQHEGLNQRGGVHGVENYGKGYAHGIISQRGGRNVAVGDDALRAVTTFDLNWYWNGFDYDARYRSCSIDGTFLTKTTPRLGINWHGEGDARGHDSQSVRLPGLGTAELRCTPGRYGRRTVTLVPDDDTARAYVETVEGEGRVDDRVETRDYLTDAETGRIGPVPLPNNGILRIFLKVDSGTWPFIVSSYQKVNDPATWRNLCEVSMAQFPR